MVMPPKPARPAALSRTLAMPSSARSLAKANTDVSMVRMLAPPPSPNARRSVRTNFEHDDDRRPQGLPAPRRQVGAHRGGHAERLRPRWRAPGGARRQGDDRGAPGAARLVPGAGTAGRVHPVRCGPFPDVDVEVVTRDCASRVLLLAWLHARIWRHPGGARLRGCHRRAGAVPPR